MANRATKGKLLVGAIDMPAVDGLGQVRTAKATYSFGVHGGVHGSAINIGTNDAGTVAQEVIIPAGAIIMDGIVHVAAAGAVTSLGSATVEIGVTGASDILGSTAKASMANGDLLDVVPDGTAANGVKVTSDSPITATIGTADLTAGEFTVFLRYFL